MNTREKICAAVCKITASDREALAETETLESLRIDSLDRLEIAMEIEEQTGVIINDDDIEAMETVGDLFRFVERRL